MEVFLLLLISQKAFGLLPSFVTAFCMFFDRFELSLKFCVFRYPKCFFFKGGGGGVHFAIFEFKNGESGKAKKIII